MPVCWPSASASPCTRPEAELAPWQARFSLLQAGLTPKIPLAIPPRDRRSAPAAHRRESRGITGGAAAEIGQARPQPSAASPRSQTHQLRVSAAAGSASPRSGMVAISGEAELISLSSDRRELLCSVIGLAVKLGLVAVAGVSLFRLAGTYQQRMERQSEISAVLELQTARLEKARDRFDQLFMTEGEQRLIREQSQWIAPNRMRVVWQDHSSATGIETASAARSTPRPASAARPLP